MRLVYLIGQPGAGKSTLMAAVTEGMEPVAVDGAVPCVEWHAGRLVLVTLGRLRSSFPGTDALSMAIQPRAVAWLSGHPYPLVVGEGDRLTSGSFFDAMTEAGVDLDVVWLDTPDDLASARRHQRGSTQSETWVKGRRTKVARLGQRAGLRLDGSRPVADLAREVRSRLGVDVAP